MEAGQIEIRNQQQPRNTDDKNSTQTDPEKLLCPETTCWRHDSSKGFSTAASLDSHLRKFHKVRHYNNCNQKPTKNRSTNKDDTEADDVADDLDDADEIVADSEAETSPLSIRDDDSSILDPGITTQGTTRSNSIEAPITPDSEPEAPNMSAPLVVAGQQPGHTQRMSSSSAVSGGGDCGDGGAENTTTGAIPALHRKHMEARLQRLEELKVRVEAEMLRLRVSLYMNPPPAEALDSATTPATDGGPKVEKKEKPKKPALWEPRS